MSRHAVVALATAMLSAALCAQDRAPVTIRSADVKDGQRLSMDFVYTRCGGSNISPALSWSGVPSGTESIAVTVIDTSVRPSGWSHWIVVNLPPGTKGLARGVRTLPQGARSVVTNFGGAGYNGPCPPEGSGLHRYEFTVWALRAPTVAIASDAKADAVRTILSGAELAHATLTATFGQ